MRRLITKVFERRKAHGNYVIDSKFQTLSERERISIKKEAIEEAVKQKLL